MRQFIVDEDFHPEVKGYSELVRCKDCTFLHDEGNGEYGCTIHDDLYVSADDWFCADGERKDGDGDG